LRSLEPLVYTTSCMINYEKYVKSFRKGLLHSLGMEVVSSSHGFAANKTSHESLLSLIISLRPRKTDLLLVRLGPHGDGGYLVPDDLDGIYSLFSPGVSSISGFEKDCAPMGMKVYMADRSVDAPAEAHESFEFTKKYIGCVDDESYMTLDAWVAESVPANCEEDLILQMDIEGSEFESILSTSTDLLRRFRVIVVEFHSLDQLWSRPFYDLASRAFAKLLQFHSCVHIHPNNCCGSLVCDGVEIPRIAEFTFLRNDRGVSTEYVLSLPSPLDEDNTSNPTLALPAVWLGGAQS
jgi:hypothetical protein